MCSLRSCAVSVFGPHYHVFAYMRVCMRIRPVKFGSNLEISKIPGSFVLPVIRHSNVGKELFFKCRSFLKFWTPLTLPFQTLYLAYWRALGEKGLAGLHDTN